MCFPAELSVVQRKATKRQINILETWLLNNNTLHVQQKLEDNEAYNENSQQEIIIMS